ncbi:MAG TPA: tetratricopeptide repeat protein [Candidatus Binatia bacterium]|nr:tetratricopeptide repeat protein [Candidatus Binatia bacterium]
MTSSPVDVRLAAAGSAAPGDSAFRRRLFYLLAVLALIYALFAGLRTVSDFDLGWQMATGRWIVQHHSVPSVDVLSYTASGQPWIYPVGAGIVFYAAYLLGGFAFISWIGAAACVATVLLLLRRSFAIGAALAIFAVPVIALRTTPRADMFTVVLFAAFLSLIWQQYCTGDAALWLLPLLMVAWVNLHLGFIAGLGLIAAYLVTELLEAIMSAAQRRAGLQRLRRAGPWLAATALATLVNPWGWGVYRAILLQQRVNGQHEYLIAEWTGLPLTWSAITNSISLRQTEGTLYLLLAFAVVAAAVALLRAQLGAAILLLGAGYVASRYVRMGALFACVVVVVGGPILAEVATRVIAWLRPARARPIAAGIAVALLAILVVLRCFDLASNRFYARGTSESTFGAGLSWWFPQRAAEFIESNNLPGEVFNTYNEGGFVAWRLGPQHRDTIDGRALVFGVQAIQRNTRLLQSSPDSPSWQEEAARYNINTILLPLGRFNGIELVHLQDFCHSTLWQPVYLDEISAVFVRRTAPQSGELLQRFAVNCATAPLPLPTAAKSGAGAFNAWSNAAAVLAALGRNSEALVATGNALDIFPGSSFVHWLRGNLLFTMGRADESEQEYLAAVSLQPGDVTLTALADSYRNRGRTPEAIDTMKRAAALSPKPYSVLLNLGYLYLRANQPDDALSAFDRAERSAPKNIRAADNGTFDFMLAQGRSVAWDKQGELARAISFQEQAAQIEPDAPEPWRRLARLYRREGRLDDANRAEDHAAAAQQKHGQ